ncbi:MFS transporter [Melittangium boletus]|uniref:MFS transporter n=1 Tax=Melittangium boletus TaxID=83453 RepID=UPI003DA6B77F
MAISGGLAVANLYYHQPLLGDMGRTFQASDHAVGLVPTVSQVGYALGLLLIVPLGDSLERRRTIVVMCCLVCLALLGVALAPSLPWLVATSALVGVTTVVPQLLVPFAAHLAPPEARGRVVGQVMSGLLIGILLSRTAAGFLGVRFGWRAVFWIAAGLMAGLAVVLRLTLPRQSAPSPLPYGALLRSLMPLVREEPVLRLHSVMGALSFASFSAFWTTLVLHLHTLPQRYGARTAGLFGVVGVVGAIAAPLVGRYSDRGSDPGGARRINAVSLGLVVLAFAVFALAGWGLWGLAAGVILLDLGAQANHIANQTRVYALRPEARNRINTVYMVAYFVGGALGAWLGSLGWSHAGWLGVCAVGAGLPLLGLAVLLTHRGPGASSARAPS